MAKKTASGHRAAVLERLARVGREHSDATVLFHATVAGLMALHPTDYKALGILDRLGPMSAGQLAAHTGLAAASITSLVDRLEARGFARRVHDSQDRRRVLVEAAEERLRGGRHLFQSTRQSLARLYERYSDAQLAIIADFLARNADRLRTETAQLPARRRRLTKSRAVPT
jgi:DNA-binding MarR family transcriptional regulator